MEPILHVLLTSDPVLGDRCPTVQATLKAYASAESLWLADQPSRVKTAYLCRCFPGTEAKVVHAALTAAKGSPEHSIQVWRLHLASASSACLYILLHSDAPNSRTMHLQHPSRNPLIWAVVYSISRWTTLYRHVLQQLPNVLHARQPPPGAQMTALVCSFNTVYSHDACP